MKNGKPNLSQRKFLRPAGELVFPAGDFFYPLHRFQVRKGLCVSEDFQDNVLKYARAIVSHSSEITLFAFDLVEPASVAEIIGETGEPMDVDVFWPVLDQMISQQSNGEEGFLPTDGRWIIFHVCAGGEVFTVGVHWTAFTWGRQWNVSAHRLPDDPDDDDRWIEGVRVLSLATA